VNLSAALGGSVHESTTAGATAGPANPAPATSLAWVSTMGPDRGLAQVKVDGQVVGTVDLYAPAQQASQVVWAMNGLAPSINHNIQIVAMGTKNAAATAAKIDYDAIVALR
jgi:glucosylceramidase